MVWLPHWPRIGEMTSIKLGLDRIKTLLQLLDNPEKKMPPAIHIAGTNGKGSTTAFVRSILEQAGLKAHVFTSPHLERFNERIVLAGREIQDDYLFSLLEECRLVVEKNSLEISFFEGITVAAFLAFSRIEADVVVLETGMGGRLDATNVLDRPLITIITPISYDHTNVLGESLTEIAIEKCGIMRQLSPCVVSMQTDEAAYAIEKFAENLGTLLIRYEYDYGVFLEDGKMRYKDHNLDILIDPPSLPGYHQFVNAAASIAAVRAVYGARITKDIIEQGVKKAFWKGRLQKITSGLIYKKIPEEWEVWLDCAHNESGAQTLGAWLRDLPDIPTYLIFSMTRNRDVNKFLSHIDNLKRIICSDISSEPLGYKGRQIPPLIEDEEKLKICEVVTSIEEAIDLISRIDPDLKKKRIIIAGSMYLVSDFFRYNSLSA